ncbi:MAG: hypothetical protein WA919_03535 [Coleofasciculaceae cyanobacterium]
MTKRRKLSDLVKEETQTTESESTEVPELQSYRLTDLQTNKVTDLQDEQVPKYLTLVRKEARLREDQVFRLTALARKLNRQKKGGERITENTLIRVAVDMLLSQSDELRGATEAELRAGLGLEDTELQ